MAVLKLVHVEHFKDRHGHSRHYFRRGHGKRIALPGLPGSDEFMAAYRAALNTSGGVTGHQKHPRSFAALADLYFQSPKFKAQKPISQYSSRNVIERFVAQHGHRIVPEMTRAHVDILIGAKAETPAAANTLLKRLRTLLKYAMALGWRHTDPTVGVDKFAEGEYHTWTDDELAQFEKRWPLGSRERTAYALALYTGQRRADLCCMTWADKADNRIRVAQAKTGSKLEIPIHADLAKALAKWKRRHVTIIVSDRQAQYTVESFGNLMADAIDQAGLPARCVLHGLRKAAARRLAEAGCSTSQIAAITGHKSLSEVERYTRAADQKTMASDAIKKLPSRVGMDRNKPKKTM